MPDPGSETQAPSIEPKRVLHAGDTTATRPGMTPEERQWLADIGELKQKGATGKDVLDKTRERTSSQGFSDGQRRNLELSFGGGKAEDNNGNLTLSADANTQEKASFENAKALVSEISGYLDYIDILTTFQQTGRPIDNIWRDRNAAGFNNIDSRAAYDEARRKALDAIIGSSAIRELYPDISAIGSATTRRDFIEKVLASDATLRNTVTQRLNSIAERASALPSVEADEEVKAAQQQKKDAESGIEDIKKQLDPLFNELGLNFDEKLQKYIISNIQQGMQPLWVAAQIEHMIDYGEDNDGNSLEGKFKDYNDLLRQKDDLEGRRGGASAGGGGKRNQGGGGAAPFGTYTQELDEIKGKINELKDSHISSFSDKYEAYQKAQKYLTSKDISTGTPNGEINSLFAQIRENTSLIKAAESILTKKEKDAQKKEADSGRSRLAEETRLINELRGVFSESVLDTLDKRYDEVAKLEQQRLEKAEKDGMNADDKAIEDAKSNNWIEYNVNDRTKESHPDNIQNDMLALAYKGEDGLKKLLLRDMKAQIPILDASGNPIPGQFVDLTDREALLNITLSQLPEDLRKRLDTVYEKHADGYRDKLMKDFYASKTLKDRLKGWVPGTDKLGLNKDEWRMLEENFKGKLANGLAKSKEADGVFKNLEASGVIPDSKMKWLIYILIAVLGVGAVATVGAGAVGVAAAGIAKAR